MPKIYKQVAQSLRLNPFHDACRVFKDNAPGANIIILLNVRMTVLKVSIVRMHMSLTNTCTLPIK